MRLATLSLPDEADTARLAAAMAPVLAPGDALLLQGPVGAGKSAFARALVRARLGDPAAEVPSPTFTLAQSYGTGADAMLHADLYRLSGPAEAEELGLLDGGAILLVEWPDRLGPLAPAGALRLDFAVAPDGEGRVLTLSGPPAWGPRLAPALEAADG